MNSSLHKLVGHFWLSSTPRKVKHIPNPSRCIRIYKGVFLQSLCVDAQAWKKAGVQPENSSGIPVEMLCLMSWAWHWVEKTTLLWEEPFSSGEWNPGFAFFRGFLARTVLSNRYKDTQGCDFFCGSCLKPSCVRCVCSYITKASLMCLQLLTPNRNHLPKGFAHEKAAQATLCPSFIVPTSQQLVSSISGNLFMCSPSSCPLSSTGCKNWGNLATWTRDFQKNMGFVLLHFAGWLVMSNRVSHSWFGGSGTAAPRWAQPHWESPILGMHFPKSLTLPAQGQLHLLCHHRVTTHSKGGKISPGFPEVRF